MYVCSSGLCKTKTDILSSFSGHIHIVLADNNLPCSVHGRPPIKAEMANIFMHILVKTNPKEIDDKPGKLSCKKRLMEIENCLACPLYFLFIVAHHVTMSPLLLILL